jgi:hypothetical protein
MAEADFGRFPTHLEPQRAATASAIADTNAIFIDRWSGRRTGTSVIAFPSLINEPNKPGDVSVYARLAVSRRTDSKASENLGKQH